MKKMLLGIILTLILALTLSMVGCGGSESGNLEGTQQVTLKLGHNSQVNSITDQATKKFAELVKERSHGNMIIDVYPANHLGGNREMAEQTALGAIDIVVVGLASFGYIDDRFNMMQVPFLFRDQEHLHNVLDGELGDVLKESMLKNDIYMLNMKWDRLPRQITSNKPIRTIEDMKGQIIRAGVQPPIEAFKRMGAEPTSVPLNEMYLAVQQGIVDGVELPIDYVYDYSIFEVNDYCNMLNHTYGTLGMGLSRITKDKKLSEDQLGLLEAVADEIQIWHNDQLWAEQQDYENKISAAGMVLVEPENVDAFYQAVANMLPELEKIWPDAIGMGEIIMKY